MPQGSINPYVNQNRSPLDAIASGLKALHEFYGIDTTKEQTRLAKIQADQAEKDATSLQKFMDTGVADARFRLKYAGQLPDLSNAPSEPPTPQQGIPSNNYQGANASQNQSALVKWMPNLKYQQEQANLAKTKAELDNALKTGKKQDIELGAAPTEAAQKKEAPKTEIVNKFRSDEVTKQAQDDIAAANDISKNLLSGNKIATALGGERLKMVVTRIQRLNEQLAAAGKPSDVVSRTLDQFASKTGGFETPESLHELNMTAQMLGKNASDRLKDRAASFGDEAASNPAVNMDSDSFVSSKLLPRGTGFTPMPSAVRVHPETGQNALWMKKPNGKWSPVQFGE